MDNYALMFPALRCKTSSLMRNPLNLQVIQICIILI